MPDTLTPIRGAEAALEEGESLFRERRIADAEACFKAALADGVPVERLAERLWMCAMLRGDFAAAWRVSDQILRRRAGASAAHLPYHLRWVWDGTPLAGRDVLIRCYHGLGDTLQFIRFAPSVKRVARRVAVAVQPVLLPLLASAAGIDELLPLDAPARENAVEIESMEAPHALRVDLASVPATVPYLSVPLAERRAAHHLVDRHDGRLKVGVVWAGGDWDPRRFPPVEALIPLAGIPGAALFCLQRGPALQQLAASPSAPRFVGGIREDSTVLETAALLTHLDLIVTVDTMVAHLAGALARPVWTLLHFGADWRWLLDREDSPWYPTIRLFRQPARGAWAPVLARVADELNRLCGSDAREWRTDITRRAQDDVATP